MGLDSHLYKQNGICIDNDDGDWRSFLGEELIYFRKFYAFNNWILSNCEKLNHSIVDGCKVTLADLLKLKQEIADKKDAYFFEEYFKEKLANLVKFINEEEKNQSSEFYYYTYQN